MASERTTLVARAKELGINTYQMSNDAIAEAIAEAENDQTEATEVTPAPVYEKPDYAEPEADELDEFTEDDQEAEQESIPAPQQAVDPVMVAVIAARQAAEEYMKQHAVAQPMSKAGTPEEVIAKKHATDVRTIQQQPKKSITIEGGMGLGEPGAYYSTVNGHRVAIVPGQTKDIPLAHYENLQRSFAQRRKNLSAQQRKARQAKEEGI